MLSGLCILRITSKIPVIQGPAENTDVFVLSSIQQYEEWRDFQGHRYVEHAQEFGWEHTCNSVVTARWRHITYSTNEYGEVARNVPASYVTVSWFKLATKISWFPRSRLLLVGLSEESRIQGAAWHFGWTEGQYQRSDSWRDTTRGGWFHEAPPRGITAEGRHLLHSVSKSELCMYNT
jgi:hypothetical protein